MEGRARVFIASSSRALTLADCLKSELIPADSVAEVWNEGKASQLGQTIIEMLEKAAERSDFAVVILTKDDVVYREGGEVAKKQARDNCIFEAGMFMGSLGRDRCFMVSSIEPKDFPVDLTGIIYLHIDEPEKLDNITLCKEAISSASLDIKQAIQERGRKPQALSNEGNIVFPLITPQELLNLERLKTEGQLEEGQVVVSARQPFGEDFEYAAQVVNNMKKGIQYIYFFHASDDGAQKICKILQLILLATIIQHPSQLKDATFQERWNAIKEKQNEVLQKLQEIRDNENLKICFLPDEPALEFSIHNANSTRYAKAYLKRGDNFIQLFEGDMANKLWGYLKTWCGRKLDLGVFHSTIVCPINSFIPTGTDTPFKTILERQLRRHFPDISKEVQELCYSN